MQDLIDAIVQDLAAASSWLLEAGAAPEVQAATGVVGSAAWQPTLRSVRRYTALLRPLIEELEATGSSRGDELVVAHTPKYATPSRAPQDRIHVEGRLLPVRWHRAEPVRRADLAALEWLEHLRSLLAAAVGRAQDRIGAHLTALLADAVDESMSEFALAQRDGLARLGHEITSAARDLTRAAITLRAAATWGLAASPRRPWPYPNGQAWAKLRDLAATIEDPHAGLPSYLHGLLHGRTSAVDVPFLYQRWVTLQLVRAIEECGVVCRQDPVPVIFLGGRLDFVARSDGATLLRLWVEPRLLPAGDPASPHESGLSTNDRGEATPDVLLVRDVPRPVAFVVDPTFTTGPIDALAKARYRSRIAFHQPRLVAGVPSRLPPARSYAAQPLARATCLLHDPEGRTGVIPMHPVRREFAGLRAWVADLVHHA